MFLPHLALANLSPEPLALRQQLAVAGFVPEDASRPPVTADARRVHPIYISMCIYPSIRPSIYMCIDR